VCERKQQIAALLYEMLALSRNAQKIQDLTQHGQVVGSPQDVLKSPYVPEFLDSPEAHSCSEHDLETAIIGRLETFLLELGKGFLFDTRQKRFSFDDRHFYVEPVCTQPNTSFTYHTKMGAARQLKPHLSVRTLSSDHSHP
jgi:predicted nuclease of restriction endonuclease-like (RecB) superfamily